MSAPDRAAWIAALKDILAMLDADPGIPMASIMSSLNQVEWWLSPGDETARMMARIEAALPCEMTGAIDPKDATYYRLSGDLHGVPVRVIARADHVAERTVTGTVTTEVVEWTRKPVEPETAEGEARS